MFTFQTYRYDHIFFLVFKYLMYVINDELKWRFELWKNYGDFGEALIGTCRVGVVKNTFSLNHWVDTNFVNIFHKTFNFIFITICNCYIWNYIHNIVCPENEIKIKYDRNVSFPSISLMISQIHAHLYKSVNNLLCKFGRKESNQIMLQ